MSKLISSEILSINIIRNARSHQQRNLITIIRLIINIHSDLKSASEIECQIGEVGLDTRR